MGDRFGQIQNHLRTPLEKVCVLPLTGQAEKIDRTESIKKKFKNKME